MNINTKFIPVLKHNAVFLACVTLAFIAVKPKFLLNKICNHAMHISFGTSLLFSVYLRFCPRYSVSVFQYCRFFY